MAGSVSHEAEPVRTMRQVRLDAHHAERGTCMVYDAQLRKQFKRAARISLAQAFWPAMGAVLLVMLPSFLLSIIYQRGVTGNSGQIVTVMLIYVLALIFVVVPLSFGAMHYYVARARGQLAPVSTVFICFGDGMQYKNSLKLCAAIFGRSILWALLEGVVAGVWAAVLVVTVWEPYFSKSPVAGVSILLLLAATLAMIVVSIFISVKIRRYDGAYIRLIDDPTLSAWQATGECADTFRGHNWELMMFDLSFIPWMLLGIINFGIGMIYLEVYLNMAFVNYFDALRQHELGVPPMGF